MAETTRAALLALVAKWKEDALGVDAMGYSQQADRIRDCADELETALAQQPEAAGAQAPTQAQVEALPRYTHIGGPETSCGGMLYRDAVLALYDRDGS